MPKAKNSFDHSADILATKLHRPPVTPDLEQRSELLAHLEQNIRRPLTLISAPAGYGKSMLASLWLESSSIPSAWLSVDEGDDELAIFVRYLLASVSELLPNLVLTTRVLLEGASLPSPTVLARYLLNDLEQVAGRFILVLDDLHLVRNGEIHEFLTELLRHPSPALHLVLVSRSDPPLPIVSLRAKGQMSEVRLADLRFTNTETAQLLTHMLHRPIDDAVAAEWNRQAEGWVTALRLAALSLRHRGEESDLRTLIASDSRYLQDYLLSEVLAHQPAENQRWLLEAALLERFCAPLCEAVCREEGDTLDGATFIQWLLERSFFLIPLDDRGEWFRLHHLVRELLRGLLRAQLKRQERTLLYRRAADWFAAQGLLDEALRHYIKGGDVEMAVAIVARNRYMLMNTQQWQRLERWLALLPDGVIAHSPSLMSTEAFLFIYRGQSEVWLKLEQSLARLLAQVPPATADENTVVQGELAVLQGVKALLEGQADGITEQAEKALRLLPDYARHSRSLALGLRTMGYQVAGELERGAALFRRDMAAQEWAPSMEANLLTYGAAAYFMEGDFDAVQRFSGKSLRMSMTHRLAESLGSARYFLGVVHYLRNELAEAEGYLGPLLMDRDSSSPNYLAFGTFALALLHLGRGQVGKAEEAIEIIARHFSERAESAALAATEAFRVELAVRQGNYAEARRLSRMVRFDVRPTTWFFYLPQLTPIKMVLREEGGTCVAQAKRTLAELEDCLLRSNRRAAHVEVLCLQALVEDRLGRKEVAVEKLNRAVELATPGRFVRSFVDHGPQMADLWTRWKRSAGPGTKGVEDASYRSFIGQVEAAFRPTMAHERHGAVIETYGEPVEALTPRETELLSLLATALETREIAETMGVAVDTVRSHTKNIYSKLYSHSRYEAVQRARAAGLL